MEVRSGVPPLAVLLLVLASVVRQGMAIKCYMCNSSPRRNGELCDSLKGEAMLFQQDCNLLPEAQSGEKTYTVCRKMFQNIIDPDGNTEERIIRQCGTEGPLNCDRNTRTNTLQVIACHCDTDLCNASPALPPPSRVPCLALALGTGLWLTYLWQL